MITGKTGEYLYLYYTELSGRDGRGVQICMAMAEIPGKSGFPLAWEKYYNGLFGEPGTGGMDTSVIDTSGWDYSSSTFPFVTYSKELDMYIMFFNNVNPAECDDLAELKDSGIYVSFSADGIQWSGYHSLITDYPLPLIGKSFSGYPTLIWDENNSTEGWLVYCHTPKWGHETNTNNQGEVSGFTLKIDTYLSKRIRYRISF